MKKIVHKINYISKLSKIKNLRIKFKKIVGNNIKNKNYQNYQNIHNLNLW